MCFCVPPVRNEFGGHRRANSLLQTAACTWAYSRKELLITLSVDKVTKNCALKARMTLPSVASDLLICALSFTCSLVALWWGRSLKVKLKCSHLCSSSTVVSPNTVSLCYSRFIKKICKLWHHCWNAVSGLGKVWRESFEGGKTWPFGLTQARLLYSRNRVTATVFICNQRTVENIDVPANATNPFSHQFYNPRTVHNGPENVIK